MNQSDSQTAIVTGASRGLGLATTKVLGQRGWTVIIDARETEPLMQAAATLDGNIIAIPGDVTDPEHREKLIHAAIDTGGLNLVVNNASMLGPSPQPRLEHYRLTVMRQVYETNLVAPLALAQAALPMLRNRKGVLVNVTSDAAIEPYEEWGGYGSSKAALNQMTRILAAEEPDLGIYSFDPGDMNTRMHQEAFPSEDISDRPSPEDSVPALLALVDARPTSGAYRVDDVLLSR